VGEVGQGLKSGVKPRVDDVKPRKNAGSTIAAIVGCLWAFWAGCLALVYLFGVDTSPLSVGAALIVLGSALIAVPPVVRRLRTHVSLLRPTFVPPVIAILLYVIATTVGPDIPVAVPNGPVAGQQVPAKPSLEQTIAMAQAALTAGDHEKAMTLLTALPAREQTGNAEVVAIMKDAMRHRQALDFASQVNTYILPEIAGLTAPAQGEDMSALWNTVSKFEDLARQFEDAKALPLNEEGTAALAQARAALSARQTALFPVLRRAWREKAAHTFWLMDIELAVSGARADTVTWTGALFAANANIQQSQEGVVQNLIKLRFRQSRYRWFSRADRITQYPMASPTDGQIGYWNGGAFVAVD
jgi:hypothetical protein